MDPRYPRPSGYISEKFSFWHLVSFHIDQIIEHCRFSSTLGCRSSFFQFLLLVDLGCISNWSHRVLLFHLLQGLIWGIFSSLEVAHSYLGGSWAVEKREGPHHPVIHCGVLPATRLLEKASKNLNFHTFSSRPQGLRLVLSLFSGRGTSTLWHSSRRFGLLHCPNSSSGSISSSVGCPPPWSRCTAQRPGPFRRRKQPPALPAQGLELFQEFQTGTAPPTPA